MTFIAGRLRPFADHRIAPISSVVPTMARRTTVELVARRSPIEGLRLAYEIKTLFLIKIAVDVAVASEDRRRSA